MLSRCAYDDNSPKIFVSLQLKLTQADFTAAQVGFVPLSLRDVKLEKSDVAWSDIGGM